MIFQDVLKHLRDTVISVTESQIRWAIKTGKVPRPEMDASLRFRFSDDDVFALVQHFQPAAVPETVSTT